MLAYLNKEEFATAKFQAALHGGSLDEDKLKLTEKEIDMCKDQEAPDLGRTGGIFKHPKYYESMTPDQRKAEAERMEKALQFYAPQMEKFLSSKKGV